MGKSRSAFPIRSTDHGSEMITVTVGKHEENTEQSTIHRNLLSAASKYFDGAINDGFRESTEGIRLPEDCPVAFEVIYQYLYSGKIQDSASWYTDSLMSDELLWLRVYNLGDCRLMEGLQEAAYERLRRTFDMNNCSPPALDFMIELFDEMGPEHLQRYVTQYAAYCIQDRLRKPQFEKWQELLLGEKAFGAAVAACLVKVCASPGKPPCSMREFRSFKAPAPGHVADSAEEGDHDFFLLGLFD